MPGPCAVGPAEGGSGQLEQGKKSQLGATENRLPAATVGRLDGLSV